MVDQVKNRKRKLREVFGEQITTTKKRSTYSGSCRHGGHNAGGDGGGEVMSKIDDLLQQAKIIQLMDNAPEKEGVMWKKETNPKKRKGGGGGGGGGPPERPGKKCVTQVPTACHAANANPMIKGGEEHRCNRVGTFERALLGLEVRVATLFILFLSLCSPLSLSRFSLFPSPPLPCYSPSNLSFFCARVCLSLPPPSSFALSLPPCIFDQTTGARSSQNHKGNSRRAIEAQDGTELLLRLRQQKIALL